MVSKRRSRQLSNARAARQYQSVKKPRTDTEKSNPTNLDDNEPSSDDDEPEGPSWYWNNSSDDGISDSDEEGNDIPGYNSESDSEPELPLPPELSLVPTKLYKSGTGSDALVPRNPTRTKPPRNFKMLLNHNKKR